MISRNFVLLLLISLVGCVEVSQENTSDFRGRPDTSEGDSLASAGSRDGAGDVDASADALDAEEDIEPPCLDCPPIPRRAQLTASGFHACVIAPASDTDGAVWCWGGNLSGQLGDGSNEIRTSATRVEGVEDAIEVDSGLSHTCALDAEGAVWCWGANDRGQLGDGVGFVGRSLAEPVEGIDDATQLALGNLHSCALRTSGRVECWGALSLDDVRQTPTPIRVGDLADITRISARGTTTCALHASGEVSCWWWGQLEPQRILGLDRVVHVAVGDSRQCAWRDTGEVWCWGLDPMTVAGDGRETNQATPVVNDALSDAVFFEHTGLNGCLIDASGQASCWGYSDAGQVGEVSDEVVPEPRALEGLEDVVEVAGGYDHLCALHATGGVSCWGKRPGLGDGLDDRASTPAEVPTPSTAPLRSVRLGAEHTCALDNAGDAWCWGHNSGGLLGESAGQVVIDPVPLEGLPEGVIDVQVRENFACALTDEKTVWCWGENNRGQLGDGTLEDRATPTRVQNLTNVEAITLGGEHVCAMAGNRRAYCWGRNDTGQLGVSHFSDSLTPVTVRNLGDVAVIDAGRDHTCAVEGDGSLYCWGNGRDGQLGDGTWWSFQPTPYQITVNIPEAIRDVDAGDGFSCAVGDSGQAYCWGDNTSGQLGIGTLQQWTLYPNPVIDVVDAVEIDAGLGEHACARRASGQVVCWGRNRDGELGDGQAAPLRPSAGLVVGLEDAQALSLGARHSCARDADGRLLCWGGNDLGQSGHGALGYSATPVTVEGFAEP